MIKRVYKKILITTLLMILFLMIIASNNKCFAIQDVVDDIGWISWKPSVQSDNEFMDKVGSILGIISVIGTVVSVATLSFIGIKFVFGSVEEKASYKQKLIPWIVGATMVFSITTIPGIIYELANDNFNVSSTNGNGFEGMLDGYDDAIEWAYNESSRVSKKEDLMKNIKNQQTSVQGTSAYWNGYRSALQEIFDGEVNSLSLANIKNHLSGLNQTASMIEEGKITKSNIISTMLNWTKSELVRNDRGEESLRKRIKRKAELYRLEMQLIEWDMNDALYGKGNEENLKAYRKVNTWGNYLSGYKDANDLVRAMVQGGVYGGKDKAFEMISLKLSDIEGVSYLKYFAYWNGYAKALKQILTYSDASKYSKYIEGYVTMNQQIEKNPNLDIASTKSDVYKKLWDKGVLQVDIQAQINRLEVQEKVLSGENFKAK